MRLKFFTATCLVMSLTSIRAWARTACTDNWVQTKMKIQEIRKSRACAGSGSLTECTNLLGLGAIGLGGVSAAVAARSAVSATYSIDDKKRPKLPGVNRCGQPSSFYKKLSPLPLAWAGAACPFPDKGALKQAEELRDELIKKHQAIIQSAKAELEELKKQFKTQDQKIRAHEKKLMAYRERVQAQKSSRKVIERRIHSQKLVNTIFSNLSSEDAASLKRQLAAIAAKDSKKLNLRLFDQLIKKGANGADLSRLDVKHLRPQLVIEKMPEIAHEKAPDPPPRKMTEAEYRAKAHQIEIRKKAAEVHIKKVNLLKTVDDVYQYSSRPENVGSSPNLLRLRNNLGKILSHPLLQGFGSKVGGQALRFGGRAVMALFAAPVATAVTAAEVVKMGVELGDAAYCNMKNRSCPLDQNNLRAFLNVNECCHATSVKPALLQYDLDDPLQSGAAKSVLDNEFVCEALLKEFDNSYGPENWEVRCEGRDSRSQGFELVNSKNSMFRLGVSLRPNGSYKRIINYSPTGRYQFQSSFEEDGRERVQAYSKLNLKMGPVNRKLFDVEEDQKRHDELLKGYSHVIAEVASCCRYQSASKANCNRYKIDRSGRHHQEDFKSINGVK